MNQLSVMTTIKPTVYNTYCFSLILPFVGQLISSINFSSNNVCSALCSIIAALTVAGTGLDIWQLNLSAEDGQTEMSQLGNYNEQGNYCIDALGHCLKVKIV